MRNRANLNDSEGVVLSLPKSGDEKDTVGVEDLLELSYKSGHLMKRSTSVWVSILPVWLSSCLGLETWKKRYFVVVGGYLYKFSDDLAEKIKGTPVPLESCTIRELRYDEQKPELHEENDAYGPLPYCFELAMLRKKVMLQAQDARESRSWCTALKNRRSLAIRENLGHSPLDPRVKALNAKAKNMCDYKLQREAEESQNRLRQGENLLNGVSPGAWGAGAGAGGQGLETFSPMQTRSSH